MGGGGDAPVVPAWDLATLAGLVLILSTVAIAVWTQPETVDLDAGTVEFKEIHTGLSGGTLVVDATQQECTENCSTVTVVLTHEDGEVISQAVEEGRILVTLEESGTYTVELEGEGIHQVEITLRRAVPHEYLPAIAGALLLVWGMWRERQEEEAE